MKIRPKIPKFQNGNNIWYLELIDYDPKKYLYVYDTSRLVDGDMSDTKLTPWKSNISGYDKGRYLPTEHGTFGINKEHYNYTLGVENSDYYKKFGEDLIDSNGNFTPTGEAWAKAVDALLPARSNATFFDPKTGQLRKSWTTQYKDAHGRPAATFTNLKDYVERVRNDLLLGARHNVFLNKGKRYFYIDNLGLKHWVDPSVIDKYNVSKDPAELGWEGTTYWDDYELTGLKNSATSQEDPNKKKVNEIGVGHKEDGYGFDWNKVTQGLLQILPGMLEAGRLAGSLYNNDKIYDAKLKGIRPNLVLTYNTYRQVVGDEATKQAYYRRGAQGMTKAAQPFTSDADRLMAYMMEAKRANDELQALGDIADNLEIRRTSDESNLHLWANTERATKTANENIAQLNYANAAKLDLIALKYAANWSSWDNFLKNKEYRLRQKLAEDKAINDEIFALLENYELLNDPEVNSSYQNLLNVIKAHTKEDGSIDDVNASDIIAARKAYQLAQINAAIRSKERRRLYQQLYISFAAAGTKITRKRKDDLLYKSARDVVEHFRKMSKMSDDSTQRSRPKRVFKLNSHPGGTRKMQLGGVAPFTVFTPVALGGETSTLVSSTGASTSNKKSSDSEGKETLDLIKALFLKVEGLPIDVNSVYKLMSNFLAKSQAFGTELSTNDIASMYLQSMLQLSNLKHSKEVYDKAKALATTNDSLSEFAVTALGHYIVLDDEGNFSQEKTWEDVLKSGKNPVTNLQLLDLRAYSPNLAFRLGDSLIENVINNGMGINKIGALIKALAGSIGESESKIEGLTQVESGKVKSGLLILANAPDGYYKYTKTNKNQQEQVNAALKYIENMLSPSLKAILETHGGTRPLIAHFLASQIDTTEELTISPLTGKASDKNSNGSGGKGDSNNSAGLAFVLGQGPRELISFNTGTSNEIEVLGIKGVLLTKSNENLGLGSTLQDATKSLQGGYLLWNKATFGGSKLNSSAYNHIILNDSTILGVDLPYTKDINGNEIPDFLMLRKMELADEDIRQNNITDIGQINLVYIKYGLDPKYTPDGKLNLLKYKRFAAIQATLDEQSLQNKDAILSDEVALAGEVERDLYKEIMKKSNKDYDLDDGISGYFKDNLYKGTIFIPYSEDIAFAALSSGQPFNLDLPNNVTTIQEKLYAPKISQYVSPQVTLSLIKNN